MARLEKSLLPDAFGSLVLVAACLLSSMSGSSQAQDPSPTPPADYSRGFALLIRAGLPDLKDWKYVSFKTQQEYQDESWREEFGLPKLSGNGWLEPAPGANGLRRIVLGNYTMIAITEKDDDEAFANLMTAAQVQGLELRVGKTSDANQAADATALADTLTKTVTDAEKKEWLVQSQEHMMLFLCTAAHFHQRGLTKQGNQMVHALLQLLPRKEALIELAVDTLANERLRLGLVKFQTDRDWKALQKNLETLITDFPRVWQARPVAERLLTQVRPRASGQPVPPIAPGPFALTEEQKDWWMKITDYLPPKPAAPPSADPDADASEQGPPELAQLASYWFILRSGAPESVREQWGQYLGAGPKGLFDISRDWDWIAVMAAGLGDLTLTTLDASERDYYGSRNYSTSFDSEGEEARELTEEEVEAQWRQLNRPRTRDDIARAFLGNVLPLSGDRGGSHDISAMDVEELRELAKSWSAKISGKKGLDFARLYLKEGSEEQTLMAASILAVAGTEADLTLLEELVLNDPAQGMQIATQILQKRKTAARPFLDKFKAKYLAMMGEMYGRDEPDEKKRETLIPDHVRSQLSALDGLVSGKGLPELVKDYVEGKMDEVGMRTAIQALGNEYKWTQPEVELLFASAAQVPKTDDTKRFFLLTTASQAVSNVMNEGSPQPERGSLPWSYPTTPGRETPPPAWAIPLFRDAIAKNRDVVSTAWEDGPPLSQYVCYQLDSIWNRAEAEQISGVLRFLPREEAWGYLESRGMARLAGKPVPPMPDAARVAEPRKQELKAALKMIGEGGWTEYFSGLTMDEKLAVQAELADFEPDPSWKKNLLTITEVSLSGPPASRPGPWQALKGRTLDPALLQTLHEQAQLALKEGGQDLDGTLTPRTFYRGLRLQVGYADPAPRRGQAVLSQWFATRETDADAKDLDLSAVSFVRLDESALVSLQGKDGSWKPHLDESPPAGFQSPPFPGIMSPAGFAKSVTEWLENLDLQKRPVIVQFGASRVPVAKKE